MFKQIVVALIAGTLSFASVAEARSFGGGGGYHSTSSYSRSYSTPSYTTPRTFSAPSYKPAPYTAPTTSRFNNSQYNKQPTQTRIVPGYGNTYTNHYYGGYHPYYHNSWYNPGGNFWFWMWAFDHHNNQPVMMAPGASAGYAVAPGPSFGAILLNILLLILVVSAIVWIVRATFYKK